MKIPGLLLLSLALAAPFASHAFESCPTNEFEMWGEYCYNFRAAAVNFDEATGECESKSRSGDTKLASVMGDEEKDYITRKMRAILGYNQAFWIGLKKEGFGKPFVWADGNKFTYTNWAPGEPNDRDGTENCVEMYRNDGKWNDIHCTKKTEGYACKARKVETWNNYNGYEYFLSTSTGGDDADWYNGRDFCQQRGGDLASILDDNERNQITQWLSTGPYDGPVWVGLNRIDRQAWSWSDGSRTGFVKWAPGYPNFDAFGKYCGYIDSKDKSGYFKNSHCGKTDKGFICKRRNGATAPVTNPPTPAVDGYCPTGYFPVGGNKCLRMVFDQSVMFNQAVQACRQGPGRNPDIASIQNAKESAYITSRLQDDASPGLYIGLYRNDHGSNWGWADSSRRNYVNWAPGEPSGSVDHCAEVWTTPGPAGTWNNIDCHSSRGYICQTFKDPSSVVNTPNPTTPNQCPRGYRPYWYSCYKVLDTVMTWNEGKSQCQLDGANLVSINTEAENGAIRSIALGLGRSVWLGLNDLQGTGQYKWTDNWMVSITMWAPGQPKRRAGGGCVIMKEDGTWEDTICTLQYTAVCKKSTIDPVTAPPIKDGICPNGAKWEEFHESCYYFETKKYKTFADASRECLLKDGTATLASIHSAQENEWIYQKLIAKGSKSSAWIGLIRSIRDRKLYWTDFSTLQYENWAPGEPNGASNGENCVEIYTSRYRRKWNDHSCSKTHNFVCKAPKLPAVPTPKPVPGYCPDRWTEFGHSCYYLMPDKLSTWEVARDACTQASKGRGDLSSVRNAEEDSFIFNQMKAATHLPVYKNYWLGMSKKGKGEPYLWTDGSKVLYTNWAPGEPNDNTGKENCVEVYQDTGMWNDHSCTEFVSYVCKMPKIPNCALSDGAKAGISIGVLLGVGILVLVILVVLFKMAIIGNPVDKIKSGFANPLFKYKSSGDSNA